MPHILFRDAFQFFALHGTGPAPEVSADLEGGTDSKIRNKLIIEGRSRRDRLPPVLQVHSTNGLYLRR
jgi:hypothetical protein